MYKIAIQLNSVDVWLFFERLIFKGENISSSPLNSLSKQIPKELFWDPAMLKNCHYRCHKETDHQAGFKDGGSFTFTNNVQRVLSTDYFRHIILVMLYFYVNVQKCSPRCHKECTGSSNMLGVVTPSFQHFFSSPLFLASQQLHTQDFCFRSYHLFGKPGRNQGLLYKHCCYRFINLSIKGRMQKKINVNFFNNMVGGQPQSLYLN